ncbi:MAG: ABC transporter permease [Nocardioides sp.]
MYPSRSPAWLLLLALLCASAVTPPLVYLGVRVGEGGLGEAAGMVLTDRTLALTSRSLGLALVVAAGCLLIGVSSALLIARIRLPVPHFWEVLAALPLAVPSYVAAYAWRDLAPGLHGFAGAAVTLILVSAPYVTLPVLAALRHSDPSCEEAARTLGRSPLSAIRVAVLPQIWPAAAAGALLAGLYALADFGAVATMRYPTFTVAIHRAYRVGFDPALAATLALVLTVLAVALVLGERAARGRWRRRQPAIGERRRSPLADLGRLRLVPMLALGAIGTLSLGVPALSLSRRMAEAARSRIDWSDLGQATVATLAVSAAGALLTVLLAIPIGALAARYRGRLVAGIESVSYLGNAIPGIVIGLAMVFVTLRLAPWLYQTSLALAFAYAVMFLPKSVGSVRTAIGGVPREWEDVGRSLGRRPAHVWLSITARLAVPGVATGGLLVMLTAMKELPATLLLRPLGMETLATQMWSHTAVNAYAAAAPYAFAVVMLAALPAYLLGRGGRPA